jgi:hypothetical protein
MDFGWWRGGGFRSYAWRGGRERWEGQALRTAAVEGSGRAARAESAAAETGRQTLGWASVWLTGAKREYHQ